MAAAGFRSVGLRVAALAMCASTLGFFTPVGPASAIVPGRVGSIIFASQRDGSSQIYAMNADGTGQTRLTNDAFGFGQPVFSPDGRQIVAEGYRDGNADIYLMNADGTGQTRLTNDPDLDYAPAFSPDGQKIAFESYRDDGTFQPEIYIMNADGTGQTRLTTNTVRDAQPVFSPDGSQIIFDSGRTGNNDIYAMDANGNNPVRLTTSSGYDGSPAVSPDGSNIAFYSSRDSERDIYLMNADGTGQTRLTTHDGPDTEPAFSPDGQTIAFSRWGSGTDVDVFAMSLAGTNLVNLTATTGSDNSPDWQSVPPDPTVVKSRAEASVSPGETIHYEITIHNNAVVDLTGVTLTDLHATCAAPPATIAAAATAHIPCTHVAAVADLGTYTNTATVDSDQTAPVDSNQVSTTVADTTDPNVVIDAPIADAIYPRGQTVNASYSCTDETPGSGINTCTGPVPSGTPIDTSTVGDHDFTVTATDRAGNTAQVTHTYTVEPATGVAGTVTAAGSSQPVGGAWVAVLRTADFSIADSAVADTHGDFQAQVDPGSYFVYVIDPAGHHTARFYGPPATVNVTTHTLTDVDPVMSTQRGSITSTVTETDTGAPIAGVWGLALSTNATNTGATELAAVGNGAGEVSLPGLAPGAHYVAYLDPTGAHASVFYPNSPNVPDATPVAVTAGSVTTANATLPAQTPTGGGATISGTITEHSTGDPIATARVVALRASDYRMNRPGSGGGSNL